MFKKAIIIILALAIIASMLSCISSGSHAEEQSTQKSAQEIREELIFELENKIEALQNSYNSYDEEAKSQIAALKKELEELKKAQSTSLTQQTTAQTSKSIFTYKINEGYAIITGFIGEDESIIVPSMIDGFSVKGIASNAFDSRAFKSVIISNGIEYIDWFAFYNCSALSAVTIPSTVKKIGYSAFEGCAPSFTIYCHRESFAQSYAQSYGLAYAFI